MHIAAYTDNVDFGGADLSMAHLLSLLDPTIEVTVFGVARDIVERVASARPNAATRVLPRPASDHDWRSLSAHVDSLREIRPDIVHANLSSPWACQYCIAAAGLVRRPRVVAVYQLAIPPLSNRQRLAKRLTTRAVHRHVGVGEQTSREIETLVGLRHGTVKTIHNGVPDAQFPPFPRLRPGPLVAAIGRLEPQKGFDLLIRALAAVDGATLVLVGDGSERGSLETLAGSVGVADRIVWAGWSDDPRRYLPSVDLFVLPSRFEGFPLVVLEALLARLPVVATDVGSVAEVVRDEETGLLVPAEDPNALAAAIRQLLTDRQLSQAFGEQGRQLVLGRFTAQHMARAFEALYEELLEIEPHNLSSTSVTRHV